MDFEIVQETTSIRSLLGGDGIRFIFSSFVNNFASFSVVAVVFIAMIGVGVAEEAGLMAALIRKLVKVSPPKTLAFIIVLVGGLSSIATDAGYLISSRSVRPPSSASDGIPSPASPPPMPA
jgi:aminobenzoyl-glutamate transport protein